MFPLFLAALGKIFLRHSPCQVAYWSSRIYQQMAVCVCSMRDQAYPTVDVKMTEGQRSPGGQSCFDLLDVVYVERREQNKVSQTIS